MSAPVMRIESRRLSNDCGIWCLSTYLGIPYEDVCATARLVDWKDKGRDGLTIPQIRAVAKRLKRPLTLLKIVEITDDHYGILSVESRRDGHVAVIRNGLVFDSDATVWDSDIWLASNGWTISEGLLVTKKKP